jgi:ABC-type Na+ transport system ATPase subunit NatA
MLQKKERRKNTQKFGNQPSAQYVLFSSQLVMDVHKKADKIIIICMRNVLQRVPILVAGRDFTAENNFLG